MNMRIDQSVLGHYGATDDPNMAVWMLNDGTMVSGVKSKNPEDIAKFYPGTTGPEAVELFMRHGAVRMDCSKTRIEFEFTRPLKPAQKKRLSNLAWDAIRDQIEFCAIRYGRKKYQVHEDAPGFIAYLANYCHFVPLPGGDGGIDITKEGMRDV